ncbi:ribonuclease H [Halobacteriales archaeon QS_1_68_20]|nr:MAG: ribonuclease H [Halobacteriales archaeon QS_1_68_20]
MPVIECDVAAAREVLERAGASVEDGNTEYELWRAELDDAVAVAYDDKVVLQGKRPADVEALLRRELHGESEDADAPAEAECYFDGASRGNPGPAAIGWVITEDGRVVTEGGERIGRATNNQAEYEALIKVLETARQFGFDAVDVNGDSQLIVRQIKGTYDVNDPDLREKRVRAVELLSAFDDWAIRHVPRGVNERADELANEAFEDG